MSLRTIGIKLDKLDLDKLRKLGKKEQRSVGFLVREAVKLYLKRVEKQNK